MAAVKNILTTRWGIIGTGACIGIFAALLQQWGNPANMGICVACFERDIAGALGLHRAAVVQYMRPEIIGFVLGALVASYPFKEFRPRTGSAPIVRFFLGVFFRHDRRAGFPGVVPGGRCCAGRLAPKPAERPAPISARS